MASKTRMALSGFLLAGIFFHSLLSEGAETSSSSRSDLAYGQNESAGRFVELNGIKLYYETYGEGSPMLLIHGNGQSIFGLRHQINFFKTHYRVIVADSRGHGRTEMGSARLTYERMTEDFNALLDTLNLRQVHVLGWSDGGIIGLLLASKYPEKVDKLAVMGANLDPQGAYDWALSWVSRREREIDALAASGNSSNHWHIYRQRLDLLGKQPNILVEQLSKIAAPTLVMAADRDVIRGEHTLKIFNALPKAHLCIFPGATHMIPEQDPQVFNRTVEKFFRDPFSRPDTKQMFQ